jgi:hypothetical protein
VASHDLAKTNPSPKPATMLFSAAPDFKNFAKTFEEASAHLKFLADSPDVHQGNLIVKALNDVNSRLGNIEKGMADLRQEVDHLRSRPRMRVAI